MTPLLVGLTVVAYGTSAPELVVSLFAAWDGQGDIAIGNVVGSNIFNIAVILGLTALLVPLRVQFQLVRFDAPVMFAVTVAFIVAFADRSISRVEAIAFLVGLAVYTVINIRVARQMATAEVEAEYAEAERRLGARAIAAFIVGGLLTLVAGSRVFVTGAVGLAREAGISEAIIGLTIVAAGTSLPELASSLVAAFRNQADIAIGNVIGSNISNILAILGCAGLIAGPLAAPGLTALDLWMMTGLAAVLIPILWSDLLIRRWEGAVLVVAYGVYLTCLWPSGL